MHVLTFGVFEQTLYPYVKTSLKSDGVINNEADFIYLLLIAADGEGQIQDKIDNASEKGYASTANRYKTGSRAIPEEIVATFYYEGAYERVASYLGDYIVEAIRRGSRKALIDELLNLVNQDTTMDADLKELIVEKARPDALKAFLALLLIYAVAVDPTEKEVVIPVGHYNIPACNDWFTGRTEELSALEENFASGNRMQILYGMGGMGKTQIAIKYVYDHYRSYSLIHWVNGTSKETILNCYRSFLKAKTGLAPAEEEEIINAYTEYMNSRSDWLIVYDNCDYYSKEAFTTLLNRLIPGNVCVGKILITSRNNQAIGKAARVEISALTEDDATDFLMTRSHDSSDTAQTAKLAKRLGCMPLALEIAGAYIAATPGFTIEKYLSKLENSIDILKRAPENIDYKETLHEVIRSSIESVLSDNPNNAAAKHAKAFLLCCAFSAPQNIVPEALVFSSDKDPFEMTGDFLTDEEKAQLNGLFDQQREMEAFCTDELNLNDLLVLVLRYSLLSEQDNGRLAMHELVQEVIRNELGPTKIQWAFAAYCYNSKYAAFAESDKVPAEVRKESWLSLSASLGIHAALSRKVGIYDAAQGADHYQLLSQYQSLLYHLYTPSYSEDGKISRQAFDNWYSSIQDKFDAIYDTFMDRNVPQLNLFEFDALTDILQAIRQMMLKNMSLGKFDDALYLTGAVVDAIEKEAKIADKDSIANLYFSTKIMHKKADGHYELVYGEGKPFMDDIISIVYTIMVGYLKIGYERDEKLIYTVDRFFDMVDSYTPANEKKYSSADVLEARKQTLEAFRANDKSLIPDMFKNAVVFTNKTEQS